MANGRREIETWTENQDGQCEVDGNEGDLNELHERAILNCDYNGEVLYWCREMIM